MQNSTAAALHMNIVSVYLERERSRDFDSQTRINCIPKERERAHVCASSIDQLSNFLDFMLRCPSQTLWKYSYVVAFCQG